MNPAIKDVIRDAVYAIPNRQNEGQPIEQSTRVQELCLEFYLQGGTDALRDEIDRVRADTARQIAITERRVREGR